LKGLRPFKLLLTSLPTPPLLSYNNFVVYLSIEKISGAAFF